jgi:predicted O-methyltransferase YrrM
MTLQSKIKTLLWYLCRPAYFSQLLSLVRQRLRSNPKENTREDAEKWCKDRSVDNQDFLLELFGVSMSDITKLYPEEFEVAQQAAACAPVKMGGPGNISLIYHISEYLKASKIIETGVAYGWSTLALLLSIKKREESQLISIDLPYAKMGNEEYVGCVVPEELKIKWELIRQPDRKGLPVALSKLGEIDMCHYDSDKTYAGRTWAYPKLWQKLREGGFFISDDIGDNIAFMEFCQKIEVEPIVVQFNNQYVGILIKQ